jgi:hypothetical protein
MMGLGATREVGYSKPYKIVGRVRRSSLRKVMKIKTAFIIGMRGNTWEGLCKPCGRGARPPGKAGKTQSELASSSVLTLPKFIGLPR